MVYTPQHKEGDAPFNMAMLFYVRLNELLAAKDRACVEGNVQGYLSCLLTIYNNIYFQIKDRQDELDDLKKDLDRASNMLSSPMPPDRRVAMQFQQTITRNVQSVLMSVDRKMMVLMDEAKMIFPRIDTNAGLDKLREKYGLGDMKQ